MVDSDTPSSDGERLPEDLYKAYGPALRRLLAAKVGNEADANDLTQEAFIRFSQIDTPDLIKNPKGYLFRIAFNLAGKFLKHRGSDLAGTKLEDVENTTEAGDDNAFERDMEARSAVRRLDEILERMPPLYRSVLLLRKRDGYSHAEIAQKLEISTHTVHHYLTKALAQCRDEWTG